MLFFSRDPKPFNEGYLPEQNDHSVYFHEYGNPNGLAVIRFHGGPGSYSKAKHTNFFDLKKCRVILFDQRGCGKSTPEAEINENTALHLVQDARRLLVHLGVNKAVIFGASWGSTLALLYAEHYPETVSKLIIESTFLGRQRDIEWIASESRRFYPDIYDQLLNDISTQKTLRQHYADLILSEQIDDQIRAGKLYGEYEFMMGNLDPKFSGKEPSPDQLKAFKTYMHYDRMDYGLTENQILNNISKIIHIPMLILHNRMDFVCPIEQSWLVHKSMPNSKLVIVPDYGHGSEKLKKVARKEIREFLE